MFACCSNINLIVTLNNICLFYLQEMEAEYMRSVKQSILDYVLLDPAEQRRLGLHMPQPVRWRILTLIINASMWYSSGSLLNIPDVTANNLFIDNPLLSSWSI